MIRDLLLTGWTRGQIVRHCSKLWRCTERNVDKYLKSVRDEWQKDFDETKDIYRQELLERYRYLYKKALSTGDLALASKISKDEAKLRGLEVEKHEIDSTSDMNVNINIEGK